MTFSSPETRDAFHRLSTGLQVLLHSAWTRTAKLGYFIHVEEVSQSGEVRLTLSTEPKVGLASFGEPT